MMNNFDRAGFEAAMVRNGQEVDMILRRRSAPIMDHLTPTERKAVDAYGAIYEAVSAGGATPPRNMLNSGGPAGPSSEGRQSRAVDQAAFLRAMAKAVAARPDLSFGKRNPVVVPSLTFWHLFAINELSVSAAMRRIGLKRGPIANAAVIGEVRAICAAVLDAMAQSRDPLAE